MATAVNVTLAMNGVKDEHRFVFQRDADVEDFLNELDTAREHHLWVQYEDLYGDTTTFPADNVMVFKVERNTY